MQAVALCYDTYVKDLANEALYPLWKTRINRARAIAHLLSAVPFVRLVGLNGSLVTGRMRPESDIDFYVALAPRRLYLGRILVTLVVHLTGWRRYGVKVRGRVCLNRFATTAALDITPHNQYHARVFSGLEPLWAHGDVYERYRRANGWMTAYGYPVRCSRLPLERSSWAGRFQRMGEWLLGGRLGGALENWQRNWQRRRIMADPRTHALGSRVVLRENELCFHAVKE